MTAPFLEVLTRAYCRPSMLAVNQASLQAQTSPDWKQSLLVDKVGNGVGWSYENMAAFAPHLTGRYIWILDDDDECTRPSLVEELKAIAAEHNPDVIMLKMNHGPLGVKPEDEYWLKMPQPGRIGVSAYVVRRELWQAYAARFLPGGYQSDYVFIANVFLNTTAVYWLDVVASRVQRISYGAAE